MAMAPPTHAPAAIAATVVLPGVVAAASAEHGSPPARVASAGALAGSVIIPAGVGCSAG